MRVKCDSMSVMRCVNQCVHLQAEHTLLTEREIVKSFLRDTGNEYYTKGVFKW